MRSLRGDFTMAAWNSAVRSGAPLALLQEMQKRDAKRGLATSCICGGMAIALAVER
jgi:acetyl-CoA acetyltransferase